MFTTVDEIKAQAGIDVTQHTLNLAQMMVETYTGKIEEDVDDGSDKALMSQAVMFQAIYMGQSPDNVLETAATTFLSQGGVQSSFDAKLFAPFLSPWAAKSCERLSWNRSRSIHTGRVIQRTPHAAYAAWTHDLGV